MNWKHRTARASAPRIAAIVVLSAGTLATFGAIYALTEQAPADTTSLSSTVGAAIERICGSLGIPFDLSGPVFTVRRLAHTVEFGVLGLLASSLAAVTLHRRAGIPTLAAVTAAACAAGSLFDQCHKLFVPGREFDALDLLFDAAGYLGAILVVFGGLALFRASKDRGHIPFAALPKQRVARKSARP